MAITTSEIRTEGERFRPNEFKYNGREWRTVSLCGEGTFSSCFVVSNDDGGRLALKVYKKGTKYKDAFSNERQIFGILKGLPSDNNFASFCVNCVDSFTLSGHNCIMMELLGCNLKELLIKNKMKGFSSFFIKKCLHDLASAMEFFGEVGVVHGDIKPTNVLWNMNSNCFQVIDFGLSFKCGKRPHQQLQSPGFQAPEVLHWNKEISGVELPFGDEDSLHLLNTAMDMWSIGCITLYISTGQHLYPADYAQNIPLLCFNCEFKSGICIHVQKTKSIISSLGNTLKSNDIENLDDVFGGLLQCHPVNRLPPYAVLKHPFLIVDTTTKPDITCLILLPTKILRLMNIFNIGDEDEKEDILCDIKEECEQFGHVVSITSQASYFSCEYHVYVEFKYGEDCEKAQRMLTGRYFNGRLVVGSFFPYTDFLQSNFY